MIIQPSIRFLIFGCLAIVYLFGMFVDVMDVDAAQYAHLSHMLMSKSNWLEFYDRGNNYLDKPPLLFWLSASSFKLFGVSNFAYKLPTVLFTVLGIWSTYRFAKLYYSESVAFFSCVILASTQAYFLFNNDVRTDALLTNSVIFAYYHLAAYLLQRKYHNFILGFVGIALAMLAKGPIGIVTVVFGFGGHLLIQRNYKDIFNWRWVLGLGIIALILSPMCYGLYTQFGTKGLRFYFWTQSFGRITGESIWENNMGVLFIFHSFLWGFLPWTILPFIGIYLKCKSLWTNKLTSNSSFEFITFSGMILSYLSLEQSRYELPHYIFVVMPFASILAAYAIEQLTENQTKIYNKINIFITIILLIIGAVVCFYCFEFEVWKAILYAVLFIVFIFIVFIQKSKYRLFYMSLTSILILNLFINMHFYPQLLKYQAGGSIGTLVKELKLENEKIYCVLTQEYSLDFYTKQMHAGISTIPLMYDFPKGKQYYVITKHKVLNEFSDRWGLKTTVLGTFPHYHVSILKPKFLNPNTRNETLDTLDFIRVDL